VTYSAAEQVRRVEFPNFELLRQTGWSVGTTAGPYCVAFRGPEEIVLVWRNGEWEQVTSRTGTHSRAA
jgi:hypothetical protein